MFTNTFLVIVLVSFGLSTAAKSSVSESDRPLEEKKLAKALLQKYEKVGRVGQPTRGGHGIIKIFLKLYVARFTYNEDGTVTGAAETVMKWHDPLLKWNPEQYDGLDEVFLPIESIWHPSLLVYEDDYSNFNEMYKSMDVADAYIKPNGEVIWYPIMYWRAYCPKFHTHKLNCTFHFGDFVRTSKQMEMYFEDNIAEPDFSQFIATPGLEIVRHKAYKQELPYTYPRKNTKYSTLAYNFIFKRTN